MKFTEWYGVTGGKMEKYILSSNELAVLNALWDAERPLTRSEMLQSIHKTDWNPNSIHMVLNNLIRKGFVQVGETVRCGQNYGRTYFPLKPREGWTRLAQRRKAERCLSRSIPWPCRSSGLLLRHWPGVVFCVRNRGSLG